MKGTEQIDVIIKYAHVKISDLNSAHELENAINDLKQILVDYEEEIKTLKNTTTKEKDS